MLFRGHIFEKIQVGPAYICGCHGGSERQIHLFVPSDNGQQPTMSRDRSRDERRPHYLGRCPSQHSNFQVHAFHVTESYAAVSYFIQPKSFPYKRVSVRSLVELES